MSASIQVFTFFVSFLYGILFSFLTRWHFHVILSNSIFMKYLSTILFMVDVVLGYVIIMYQINQGVIHIYFLINRTIPVISKLDIYVRNPYKNKSI